MAEVRLPAEQFDAVATPTICAVSGVPTATRRTFSLERTVVRKSSWLSVPLFLVGGLFLSTRTLRVGAKLPIARAVTVKRAFAMLGFGLLVFVLMIVGIVVLLDPDAVGLAGCVALLALGIWLIGVSRHNAVRGAWIDDHTVVVRNLHPDFVSAIRSELARRLAATRAPVAVSPPAGWHPDPSGQFDYRYWDGSAWTEHTSGPKAPPG